jgi:ABC-type amino acid transport substrate-binding protein
MRYFSGDATPRPSDAQAQATSRGDALAQAPADGSELSGFSIDLWNALAQSLKVGTAWVDVATVGDQLRDRADRRVCFPVLNGSSYDK